MRRSKHWAILSMCISGTALAATVTLGDFSQSGLDGWEEESFAGHTDYQVVEMNGRKVLRADTQASASGLFREIDIDLNKTPYLNWSWRVDNIYSGHNERSKQGDDYPARVYVVVSGGLFFWKTKAINYVWSSNQAVDTTWDNAYTGNAKMIAVQSGAADTDQWITEKRNVREDFKRLFGADIDEANAIAIMSDSDDTGQSAMAWYGDIYLSSE
ncbi:hypothetical protein Tel_07060 [Candidatus Tenderia electrophaga]|uniref:DUF3047 domain-containing protein n=1 Tax=Candidatus Tenderia electrophaga TaxID=1748243 RepID=A0A0S2TCS8_9GAMM|nr:hypothetical protein Tel_07060 [Candidatus Tenderia electrophaga]